jgi:ribosome-binding protein aMBF1 (putative translation factor)
MKSGKQNLAAAVREARTGLGLSQEKLAEILNIDSRTIRGIEAGRGNQKI